MFRRIVFLAAYCWRWRLATRRRAPKNSTRARTLRMLVGFSPGGGYDTYTRYIARYIKQVHPRKPDPGGSEHARSREPDHRQPHLQAGQAGREDLGRVESRR